VPAEAVVPAAAVPPDPGAANVAAATAAASTAAVAPPPLAAPTPAAPGPAPVGAGGGDYVVAIGVFADVANARALAGRLRAAGLPVRADSVPVAGKDGLRLRVGPYADRAAAEAARLRAQSATNVSGKVIALDGSAVPATAAPAKVPATPPKPAASTVVAATPAKPAAPAPAPASVPAPSASDAPATASAGFAVQLSAPAAEADANALRDKARAAGFPSFVQRTESETGTRWRVRIGPFADRAAAGAARDAANGKLGTHGIVMPHP
jgi:cell division septation protein DedD